MRVLKLKYAILRRINRRAVLRQPWVKPVAPYLEDRQLWKLRRESIARGLAAGLFFGLLVPVAQFFFAAGLAVVVRGNLAVAALATFVSNPLTVAPLYWLAYRVGVLITGDAPAAPQDVPEMVRQGWWGIAGWWAMLERWYQSVGETLIVGLLAISAVAAVLGYLLVRLLWRERRPVVAVSLAR